MSEAVHEHHPGDQDIAEQVSTFRVFGKMMKWGSLTLAVLLVMLVLWFCVSAGFFAGAGAGIVLTVVGVTFLRSKPTPAH
jgi:hypothetical protein